MLQGLVVLIAFKWFNALKVMISVQRKKRRLREGRVVASDLPGASKEGCWRWEEGICVSYPTAAAGSVWCGVPGIAVSSEMSKVSPSQTKDVMLVGCLGSLIFSSKVSSFLFPFFFFFLPFFLLPFSFFHFPFSLFPSSFFFLFPFSFF